MCCSELVVEASLFMPGMVANGLLSKVELAGRATLDTGTTSENRVDSWEAQRRPYQLVIVLWR